VRQPIIDIANRRAHGAHPGLLLQRYLTKQADPEERRALFDATLQAARSESLRSLYAEAFARWTRSVPQDEAHRSEQLATASRLVVGLGSENVLETGLRLHHTYGVPIIPGSALKGLASHYCHDVWGQRHNEAAAEENRLFRRGGAHHSLLFGTTDDGGVITFHDAWITPGSLDDGAFRLDVMTPHHPKWQTNEAPPTDFDSPVPVSFLSVAGTFEVRLCWSGPAATPSDTAEAWTALAMKLLKEAVAEWGIGGKTSSGYGRLLPAHEAAAKRPSQAGSSSPRTASVAPGPKHARGEKITVTRVEDPKGKVKFRAPDGLLGHFAGENPPGVGIGETTQVWVANVNPQGYTLTLRQPTKKDKKR